ncbi:APC family permease [Labrys wisconsinensis]|uniref:Amino acid transporter n=1 Tax=Labrys wisconsinensis TaxID=425677 RepID=A0ABU0JG08_9HYPH|nr:amino acid permease [Labrys wisconsinensis]MDQ0472184.1 amino acid transporter [Labrys wisconsinensis]
MTSIDARLELSPAPAAGSADDADLAALGYKQKLHRTMGPFTSFALAFSMVSINTGVVTLFADPFTRVGGIGILLWLLVIPLVACIVAVYAHLSARIPVTGYAYQWSSRLVGKSFGWFTGWVAFISFIAGTAGTASAIGSVFAPEIWAEPTQGQIQMLSIAATLVVCALNIFGIRLATRINDLGAVIELIGTVVLIAVLIGGLFYFFGSTQGIHLLVETQPVSGLPITFSTVALATLLPVSVLLGWEGAADLAEETHDPRRTAAKAMIRAVAISSVFGIVLFTLLALAIPGPIADFLKEAENPVILLVRRQVGPLGADAMIFVAFASIFACLIANMAVATRMSFALARDNMLPASQFLASVHERTGTPVASILLITVIAILLNLASGGIVTAIYSMVGLTYYLTYFLTLLAAFLAWRAGRIPEAPAGTFSLGRWLVPTIFAGLAWTLCVVATFTLPEESHPAAIVTLVVLAIGTLWWALVLRKRLSAGTAGPPDLL